MSAVPVRLFHATLTGLVLGTGFSIGIHWVESRLHAESLAIVPPRN